MRKARDSGCLFKDCESFPALRRGVTSACASIDKILERVKSSSTAMRRRAEKYILLLKKIREVIATSSKCDTIVACQQPYLSSNKLEDATPDCLDADIVDFADCGWTACANHW